MKERRSSLKRRPPTRARSVKPEPIAKIGGHWKVLGTDGKYHGEFATRGAARQSIRDIKDPTEEEAPVQNSVVEEAPVQNFVAPVTEEKTLVSDEPIEVTLPERNSAPVNSVEEKRIMKITLTKSRTNKGGGTLYGQEGVTASVRFPKSLWAEGQEPPATLVIEAPEGVFALPGAIKAKVTSDEQAAKIRANAEKAKARAEKAAKRAAKAQAKADALATKAPAAPAPVTESAPVPA